MRINILFLLVFASLNTWAQFPYVYEQSVPVSVTNGESLLRFPWAGGLNASQFNTMDLNNDLQDDLVIFDRMANQVITFISENNQYKPAPEFEILFPDGITFWLLLRDYNGDGLKDIFTGDNLGIKVYINTTQPGEALSWEPYLFFTGFPEPKSTVLLTKGLTTKINLQLNYDDMPFIGDVDGDGDLDIVNPKYLESTLEFHRNYSVERYGTTDSLDFERVTSTWGSIRDCSCGNFTFDGTNCSGSSNRTAHAGGKSILLLDEDGDGDLDLLFSELQCPYLFLLRNEGTNDTPQFSSASQFGAGTPVILSNYPAAYFEDLDFDGKKDLVVSPNMFVRETVFLNLNESVWFYKNTGTTDAPVFSSPNRNFLQEEMIDVGDNSTPAFFDVDGDGDLDMMVGTYANNFRGTIFFYENTGTSNQPEFNLVSDDLFSLSGYQLLNVRPIFADLNGDGTQDLALTANTTSSLNTRLYYFPNDSPIGLSVTGSLVNTGFSLFPFEPVTVKDINGDGKPDILLGKQNGSLEFWKNTGTKTNPEWELEDESFLGLGPDFLHQYPAAFIADLNADRKPDMLLGDLQGTVTVINNFASVETATRQSVVLFNPALDSFEPNSFGSRAWPVPVNLFRSDKPAIAIGNSLGGIHLLKPVAEELLPKGPIIEIFPNPVYSVESNTVTILLDQPGALKVVSQIGQEISTTHYLQAFEEFKFTFPPLSRGVYLFYFTIGGKIYTRKIMKL